MNFILKHDLLSKIKKQELDVLLEDSITGDPDNDVKASISAAEDEIKGYVRHRYDVSLSMPPIWYFDPSEERQTDEPVILYTENEYNEATDYALNDIIVTPADARVYRSLSGENIGNTPASSPASWQYIGTNATFFKSLIDDNDDDPIVALSWEPVSSDPRNALLKRLHVDLVLYDLHARIKPRQIPDHRIALRDDAITYLRDVADPRKNVTLNLPLVDHGDKSGVDLTHGSNDKITHSY